VNVLVDTSVWSHVLRKNTPQDSVIVRDLSELIKELRVKIIGPIRQEILSGIKSAGQFEKLKSYLSAFPDLSLETQDFEKAAVYYNTCRQNGIQGSNTNFLICAVAFQHQLEIFTTDNDFLKFQSYIPVKLYMPRT
jgi:predicted nucleic acid-binding protein